MLPLLYSIKASRLRVIKRWTCSIVFFLWGAHKPSKLESLSRVCVSVIMFRTTCGFTDHVFEASIWSAIAWSSQYGWASHWVVPGVAVSRCSGCSHLRWHSKLAGSFDVCKGTRAAENTACAAKMNIFKRLPRRAQGIMTPLPNVRQARARSLHMFGVCSWKIKQCPESLPSTLCLTEENDVCDSCNCGVSAAFSKNWNSSC